MLELHSLTAGYAGSPILRDLSLSVPEASLTVIAGPNGCGKTTLLKALSGMLPCTGRIAFRGSALTGLPARDLAKVMAFLPQSRPVPEISAGRLVLHGRFPYLSYPRTYREEDRQAARQAMEQLGILHLEERSLPSLSGGERQKVYLAMLLAQDTPIILMDEPTASLDLHWKFELMALARQLAGSGKTVVTVLHELDLAMQYADRVAIMDRGSICLCAPPEEVFSSRVIESVFRLQARQIPTEDGVQYYFLPR